MTAPAQPGRAALVDLVAGRIHDILPAEADVHPAEHDDLRDLPAFDSLAFLELLAWLEGSQGVVVPDEELLVENFHSVGRIVDYLLHARAEVDA